MSVHRLVLEIFVGPCPYGQEACHNDSDPSNNRVSNLRWDTHQGNMKDREAGPKHIRGSRNGFAKLTEEAVVEIRLLLRQRLKQTAIARRFKISGALVSQINKRTRWKHVL